MTSREQQRKYKERNAEVLRARARDYQRKHAGERKEEKRTYMEKYYEINKDVLQEGFRVRYAKNKDAIHAQKKDDPRKRMLSGARSRAKEKNIEFSITVDDVYVPVRCPLLGLLLEVSRGAITPNSPSLDRKDNTAGYTPGNVWVTSMRANILKRDATSDELLMLATNLKLLEKF